MIASAPRRRSAALPPEERRTLLVQATLPLLLEHGERITTRQIAEAAGIAEGTIFRAFADKDELIRAVVEAAMDDAPMEAALEALDPSTPLPLLVRQVVEVAQRRMAETWRLLAAVGPRFRPDRGRPAAVSPTLVRLLGHHRDVLRVSAPAAATALQALVLGMTHPLLVPRPAPPRTIAHLFLHGATGPAAPC